MQQRLDVRAVCGDGDPGGQRTPDVTPGRTARGEQGVESGTVEQSAVRGPEHGAAAPASST